MHVFETDVVYEMIVGSSVFQTIYTMIIDGVIPIIPRLRFLSRFSRTLKSKFKFSRSDRH